MIGIYFIRRKTRSFLSLRERSIIKNLLCTNLFRHKSKSAEFFISCLLLKCSVCPCVYKCVCACVCPCLFKGNFYKLKYGKQFYDFLKYIKIIYLALLVFLFTPYSENNKSTHIFPYKCFICTKNG